MNVHQVIRMILRLARARSRGSGNRGGQGMSPQMRAQKQRRRTQVRGMRLGARLLRMFGRS